MMPQEKRDQINRQIDYFYKQISEQAHIAIDLIRNAEYEDAQDELKQISQTLSHIEGIRNACNIIWGFDWNKDESTED